MLINHLLYADDLCLIVPSLAGLDSLIKVCVSMGAEPDVAFKSRKSTVVHFSSSLLKDVSLPCISVNGEPLSYSNSVKYLGHVLTSDLSDDADIARQCRQLYAQGNILLRKFHMCSVDVKLKLFKSFCAPLYTAHLWWQYKKCSIKKLYTAYHNVLKLQLGLSKFESSSTVCAFMNVPCCAAVIRNLIYNFTCRLENSSNDIIVSICTSSLCFTSRVRKHWYKFTHVYLDI